MRVFYKILLKINIMSTVSSVAPSSVMASGSRLKNKSPLDPHVSLTKEESVLRMSTLASRFKSPSVVKSTTSSVAPSTVMNTSAISHNNDNNNNNNNDKFDEIESLKKSLQLERERADKAEASLKVIDDRRRRRQEHLERNSQMEDSYLTRHTFSDQSVLNIIKQHLDKKPRDEENDE